jgi:hypothetical protein
MTDNKPEPTRFELLIKSMSNDIAREIGEMDLDEPGRAECVKELYALSELSRSLRTERNKMIHQRMDELACKIGTLKQGDARSRADSERDPSAERPHFEVNARLLASYVRLRCVRISIGFAMQVRRLYMFTATSRIKPTSSVSDCSSPALV